MVNLTETRIKAIEIPPDKIRVRVADDMRGLYLVVGKQTKTWEFKRKNQWYRLGSHPALSAHDAREAAQDVLNRLARGKPLNLTVEAAHDRWVRSSKKPRAKTTLRAHRDALNLHFADWKEKRLEHITPEMLEARHAKISKRTVKTVEVERTKIVDGKTTTESVRVRRLIGGPFAANNAMAQFASWWAVARHLDRTLDPEPTEGVIPHWKPKKDESHLLANIKEWSGMLDDIVTSPIRLVLYRFALLTGLRANDLRTLRWEHITVGKAGAMLHLPNPKGGAERAFSIPLVTAHLELLGAARAAAARPGCPWVFPAVLTDGHIRDIGLTRAEALAFRSMPWTPHSLRRAFISLAFESERAQDVQIKLLVNHNVKGVTGTYIAKQLDLRRPMRKIVAYILAKLA